MRQKFVALAAIAVFVTLTSLPSFLTAYSQRAEPPRIILSRRMPITRGTGVLMQQEVEINETLVKQLSTLANQGGAEGQLKTPFLIHFNLSATADRNSDFVGAVEYAVQQSPQTVVIRGSLNDIPAGIFNLIIHRDLMGLRIFSPRGNYSVHPNRSGAYVVELEDPNAPFLCKVIPPRRHRKERERPPSLEREDGSLVDVLIVFTTGAKAYYNDNVANLERAVREMEAFANLALSRSLPDVSPPVQLRFVAIEEVPNTVGSSLEDYAYGSAGTPIRDKRAAHKADLVIVIRRSMSWAGQAFAMCSLDSPLHYAGSAYAHVRVDYLEQIKTLPHEIAHLFGGQHDPGNVDSCSVHRDSRGHFFSAPDGQGAMQRYGTILSYRNSFNRIPGFSNPSVLYQGVATGKVNERNNARAIRDSRNQLSNYRISSNPLPGNPPVINVLEPIDGAQLPVNSRITVSVRITDNESVASADLYWQHTNSYLRCPGNGGFWSCTKVGDVYTWLLDVSSGVRLYQIVATDNRGEVTISPFRRVSLISP